MSLCRATASQLTQSGDSPHTVTCRPFAGCLRPPVPSVAPCPPDGAPPLGLRKSRGHNSPMSEGDHFVAGCPLCCCPSGFAAGFTLLELLVVLAIGAILAAIAVPSLRSLVAANQLSAATDTFAAALYEARSEAGKLGVPVALKTAPGAGPNWGLGWTSFVDTNANGIQDPGQTPPEVTLRTGAAQPATLQMISTGAAAAAFANVFWFDPSGRLLTTQGTPAAPAEFLFCQGGGPANGGAAKMVTVSASGRVRTARNNSSGVPLDDSGKPVPCP